MGRNLRITSLPGATICFSCSATIANAFADAYLDDQLEAKYQAVARANNWLNGRLGDLKGKVESRGEASLIGHLKNGDDEKTGSEVYVSPDPANDAQLIAAVDFLHGRSPTASARDPAHGDD